MQGQATTPDGVEEQEVPKVDRAAWRAHGRQETLQRALRKRSVDVPTYTIPEAAALLSVSQEHLYRLVRADAFPAVRMRTGAEQGRYVIPAEAVERLLKAVTEDGGCTDVTGWVEEWRTGHAPKGAWA